MPVLQAVCDVHMYSRISIFSCFGHILILLHQIPEAVQQEVEEVEPVHGEGGQGLRLHPRPPEGRPPELYHIRQQHAARGEQEAR